MKERRIVLSYAAVADILEQSDWYVAQSGEALAKRWEKAVTTAVLRAVRRPAAGAPCAFQSPELHGVRRTTITGFPSICSFTGLMKRMLWFSASSTELVTWSGCYSRGLFKPGVDLSGDLNGRRTTNGVWVVAQFESSSLESSRLLALGNH